MLPARCPGRVRGAHSGRKAEEEEGEKQRQNRREGEKRDRTEERQKKRERMRAREGKGGTWAAPVTATAHFLGGPGRGGRTSRSQRSADKSRPTSTAHTASRANMPLLQKTRFMNFSPANALVPIIREHKTRLENAVMWPSEASCQTPGKHMHVCCSPPQDSSASSFQGIRQLAGNLPPRSQKRRLSGGKQGLVSSPQPP